MNFNLKKLSSYYHIPINEFQKYWDQAVEEAIDMGEGNNYSYIIKTLQSIIGLNEALFNKHLSYFLEQKFIESNYFDYEIFIREDMIKSSFPQSNLPELPKKKKKKKDINISESIQYLFEDTNDEIIDRFITSIELKDENNEVINLYLKRFKDYLFEFYKDEKQRELISKFSDLILNAANKTIDDNGKKDLVDFLKIFFPDKNKQKKIVEDLLDQTKDVFGSAFGSWDRWVDFFKVLGTFAKDITLGDDEWREKKENELEKQKDKEELDKEKDFSFSDNEDEINKKSKKEPEKKKIKDPDEFHKIYGKCPEGFIWDDKTKSCQKKEIIESVLF